MPAPDNWLEQALILWQAHKLQALRNHCQQKLASAPHDAQAHYFTGLAWLEEDPEKALLAYRTALQLNPDHPDYLRHCGHLLRRMGRWQEALAMYRLKAEKYPKHLDSWQNLTLLLEQREEWEDLRGALSSALQYFPKEGRFQEMHTRLTVLSHQNKAEKALQTHRFSQALQAYQQAFLTLRGPAWHAPEVLPSEHSPLLPPASVRRVKALPEQISINKLQHDGEQWRYLAQHGRLPKQVQTLLPVWESWISAHDADRVTTSDLHPNFRALLETLYDAPVFWPQSAYSGPLLNSELDFPALESSYLQSSVPILWFDHLLAPSCLSALRDFCLSATLWRDYYLDQGYLGAFMDDGFVSPLLMQLAVALQEAFPRILGELPLSYLWGFKYGQSSQGIRLHADQAQVNLNFWLTPDSANLNPQGGGLQVYDKMAPTEWDFHAYNDQASQARMQSYLWHSQAQMLRIPHRQNRAVLFHSRLIHRTDPPHFQAGYENRRINVTMLFG